MTMTKIQALRKTAKMWEDIASETLSQERIVQKKEILEKYGEDPAGKCYLCEYMKQKYGWKGVVTSRKSCEDHCPVNWWGCDETGRAIRVCVDIGSVFNKWAYSKDYLEAAYWAEEIRNIAQTMLYREIEKRKNLICKFTAHLVTLIVLWAVCYMFGYFVLGRLIV